jgi:hypothetical protein
MCVVQFKMPKLAEVAANTMHSTAAILILVFFRVPQGI